MSEEKNNQVITGIDIPFMDLVVFFFKASLAAVPAIIILSIIIYMIPLLVDIIQQSAGRPF